MERREDRLYIDDLLQYFSNDPGEVIRKGYEIGACIENEDGVRISFDKDIFNKYLVETDMSISGVHPNRKKKVKINVNVDDKKDAALNEMEIRLDEREKTLQFVGHFITSFRARENALRYELSFIVDRLQNFSECMGKVVSVCEEFDNDYQYWVHDLMNYMDGQDSLIVGIEEPEEECYVYYIANEQDSLLKIGISGNVEQRIKSLQTSCGDELKVLHTIKFNNRKEALEAERFLHSFFERYRKKPSKINRSSEWFDFEIIYVLMDHFKTMKDIKNEQKKASENRYRLSQQLSQYMNELHKYRTEKDKLRDSIKRQQERKEINNG